MNMSNFKDFVFQRDKFQSPTLFKEMAVLRPNAISKIRQAFEFIHSNNIKGCLIGGIAVSHYIADRPLTPDVDYMVENISALTNILQTNNMQFHSLGHMTDSYEGIGVPQIDTDFLDAHKGKVHLNEYIIRTAITTVVGGTSVSIINPEVLTIMKFDIGRSKDLEDAFKLLKITNKDNLRTHLNALKGDLTEIDAKTIWSYAKNL